ncbi:uncharacterized protein BKA55DRAFT_292865 [Fusarium redolens]|uniref:DUF6606 domain-containing protein n=1 Tax=Fusarium redolens TaxID=48865 RepID=A0A9P9JSG3_FUSRE|nr:uncharacterized protein BKA55DRAFT_292865 [Fusarium redolens]KAH7202881.1 hypothetical protein BKA55DRAFT_292865 [Fusarium redolens]
MGSISSNDQIKYLFHHLFLPPQLPGGDDMSAPNTIFLADSVLKTLQRFTVKLGGKDVTTAEPVISMLQTMRDTTDPKGLLDYVGV